jgi:hypothetical protein
MSVVRPFLEEDIPQVADLHRRVFPTVDCSTRDWLDSYRRYFREVFLNNPSADRSLSSLVCEEKGGRIVGFLGVVSRSMLMKEQPVQMAISSQFIVEPARRGLVGLKLLKRFLDGPQDLSMTDEANNALRSIWEGCGGSTALLYSMHWIRPLRPVQVAVALLRKRIWLGPFALVSKPIAWLADALVTRVAQSPFHLSSPRLSAEDLDEATLLKCLPEFVGDRSLRPVYTDGSLKWVLERATQKRNGRLQKAVLRNDQREIVGWYLYSVNHDGIGEVLQIAARKHTVHDVLDHLFYDAWHRGVTALIGRLDPTFIQELSDKYCLFHRRGSWTLIHSKRPEALEFVNRGDAFLTRLEGEWSLRFQ